MSQPLWYTIYSAMFGTLFWGLSFTSAFCRSCFSPLLQQLLQCGSEQLLHAEQEFGVTFYKIDGRMKCQISVLQCLKSSSLHVPVAGCKLATALLWLGWSIYLAFLLWTGRVSVFDCVTFLRVFSVAHFIICFQTKADYFGTLGSCLFMSLLCLFYRSFAYVKEDSK